MNRSKGIWLKIIGFFVVCFVVGIFIASVTDKTDTNKNIKISQENWAQENFLETYDHHGYFVENNNDVAADISITAQCYDKDDNFLGEHKAEILGLGPNSKYFFIWNFEENTAYSSYEFDSKSSKLNILESKDLSPNYDSKNNSVTMKNSSSEDTDVCYCCVIFYDSKGKIVDAITTEMHDGRVPSGKSVKEELKNPPLQNTYSKVEILPIAYSR